MIDFKPYGDSAILINFEQVIDKTINDKVVFISKNIENTGIPGLLYCFPAYCSITIGYNPSQIKYVLLIDLIKRIIEQKQEEKIEINARNFLIPVCYEPPYALDLADLSNQLAISQKEIIKLHYSTAYQVYMLGFLPGFPYMGTLPIKLNCKRKEIPRKKVTAGSVGLAGRQTGIYPLDAPGGWQIIGRTPVPIFNPKNKLPFLFTAGDTVSFYPISIDEFERMEKELNKGYFDYKDFYG
jgi:inhibitor of KinA